MFFLSEAYVLNKQKLGDFDLLVELLTPLGKIFSVAKGAQKSKRRFVNILEEFNFIYAHFRKRNQEEIPILEVADLIYLPESLRKDYEKFLLLSYLNELISKVSYPKLEVEYFSWLKELVKFIDQVSLEDRLKLKFLKLIKSYFEWNFLCFLGWKPQLNYCVVCHKVPQRIYYFSVELGGVLCVKCKNERSFSINKPVVDLLRKFIKMPINLVEFLKIISFTSVEPLDRIGEEFWNCFLPYKVKSLKLLKEVLKNGKVF